MLVSELVRKDKPISTGATAVYPYSKKIEQDYRFVSRFEDEVLLHKVVGDKIHLPRALCPVGVTDERIRGEAVTFAKKPTPKPNQVDLFEATAQFLLQDQSGIVCAYTGWGKTVLGYHAAYIVGRKTLVITTKDDIYKQWIDGAQKFLGLEPHEIGEIRGDKCEVIGTKFVVAMIHSLSKDGKYPPEVQALIAEGFGLVIFDECHRVPADQFSAVVDMFPALLRLGLSATPHRSDGKETVLFAHIGPIRAKTEAQLMIPKILRVDTGWKCPRSLATDPITGQRSAVRIAHQPGRTAHIEKIIAADDVRNAKIAEMILNAYTKGRKTVVFSTLHNHLDSIKRQCLKLGLSGKDIGYYIGATTKAEKQRRDKEKVKPILLTTYTMMGEGTSIDWLDTCILAMPRASVEQPVGRIRREYPDKKEPVVFDLLDSDSPIFHGYSLSREKWYKSIGATIKEVV